MALLHRRQHGGRERRDREREPQPEDQDAREHLGEVGRVAPDPRHQRHAGRRHDRPAPHEPARPVPVGERAEALRQEEHHHRDREERGAGLDRRVARHLLEVDPDEEQRAAEPRVHRERREVAHREVARAEQVERHHRMRRARLVEQEEDQAHDAAGARGGDQRVAEAEPLLLDQREDGAAEPEHAQQRAEVVDARAALGRLHPRDRAHRDREREDDQRDVDQEDQPPREASIRTPPPSGPITIAMPVHAVQVPIAGARSSSSNVFVIIASVLGTSSAPATP